MGGSEQHGADRTGKPGAAVERHVKGACPLDCPDGCAWIVTVHDDVPVRIRGNPDHPMTSGGLCKKVYPWLEYAADPNRLVTPLRRIRPKGSSCSPDSQSAAFEPISWQQALAEIATRLKAVIDTTGAAAIWPYHGTGIMGWLQGAHGPAGNRLWNHLGVSAHDVTICSPSGHVGMAYSMGASTGMDPEDVVHADVVVIWGANVRISGQHWWPFVERARKRGAKIIVIDPTRTRTAERADLHLAVRPGTDGALALGVCKALIGRGLIDAEYVGARTIGFDEFAASISEWSPERVAEVCDVPVDQFEELVTAIGTRSPLALKFGHGAQRTAGGGQVARAVSCIPALLGSFAHLGGGIFYSTGPLYQYNRAKAGADRAGARPRTLAMTHLVRNLESADPPIDALLMWGANPVVSNPDTVGVRRALSRPDLFTVVIDLFHTPTTDYADIVLPSTMAHEHLDLNDSFAHTYANLNQPAVAPPGQCLPHTEIFRRLAHAMGVDDRQIQASDEELLDALLDTPEFESAGIDAAHLREHGFARLPNAPRPFQPFSERFPTTSGCFEFASDRAEADGAGRLPHFVPGQESGQATDEVGGYDLIAAASDWHLNSTFAGTKKTLSRTQAAAVTVHPADATRDGLLAGQEIVVANRRGSFIAKLAIDDLARRGTAVCTKGWWDQELNSTVEERDSDMGNGAVFHDNRVTITAT